MAGSVPFGPHVDDGGRYQHQVDLVRIDPLAAWTAVVEIASATDDAGAHWVGDIIEDLLALDEQQFAPLVLQAIDRDPGLRRAFIHVVPTVRDEVLADRLLAAREEIERTSGIA